MRFHELYGIDPGAAFSAHKEPSLPFRSELHADRLNNSPENRHDVLNAWNSHSECS
jgi:hypothetical protein